MLERLDGWEREYPSEQFHAIKRHVRVINATMHFNYKKRNNFKLYTFRCEYIIAFHRIRSSTWERVKWKLCSANQPLTVKGAYVAIWSVRLCHVERWLQAAAGKVIFMNDDCSRLDCFPWFQGATDFVGICLRFDNELLRRDISWVFELSGNELFHRWIITHLNGMITKEIQLKRN